MKSNFINFKRIIAIAEKEKNHILRDPFALILAFGIPVLFILVFGFAIDLDVKNIKIMVDDRDKSASSRTLTDIFQNTGFFNKENIQTRLNPEEYLSAEMGKAVIIIETGFEKKLLSEQEVEVQITLDGADNSTIASIYNYLGGILEAANSKLAVKKADKPLKVRSRFLFNPELNSQKFIIPGLIVAIIAIVSILLTSLTVAREWENGSMELLLSTPVKPLEIIIGKLIPYTAIGFTSTLLIYLMARIGFSIPFQGSYVFYMLSCFLFITAYLAQGLLISVVTRKQLISMQISMISGLLPSLLLSGFIFPVESMPRFFRIFTCIFPARWFVEISRDSFLKGSSWVNLQGPFIALLIINIILVTLATRKFKRNLE